MPSAKDNDNPQRMKGSQVGWRNVLGKMLGCAIEGWDIFQGGRFQAMDSVNLSPFVRFFADAKKPPTSAGIWALAHPLESRMARSFRRKLGG